MSSARAASAGEIDATLQRARAAQLHWRQVPIADRAALMERFCAAFEARAARDRHGAELADGPADTLCAQ